jgi:hypothetical protein
MADTCFESDTVQTKEHVLENFIVPQPLNFSTSASPKVRYFRAYLVLRFIGRKKYKSVLLRNNKFTIKYLK